MKKLALLLIFLLLIVSINNQKHEKQQKECFSECFEKSGCAQSQKCVQQVGECENLCSQFKQQEHAYPCFKTCFQLKFQNQMDAFTTSFLQCEEECVKEITQETQINLIKYKIQSAIQSMGGHSSPHHPHQHQTTQDKHLSFNVLQQQQKLLSKMSPAAKKIYFLKRKIAANPKAHPGTTLQVVDCSRPNKQKKAIFIKIGNQHPMVINYFKSRCDYRMLSNKQQQTARTNWYFKWVDYTRHVDWKNFKTGRQIINHIPNFQQLLSDKDGIYKTLSTYDKKQLYNFTSHDFHFDTYIFNLKSKALNPSEKHFFDNVNTGYWLAKDPTGSLGLGIKLFRGTELIKKNIQNIKAKPNIDKNTREIAKFSVIQQYLHNPLLLGNKKFDLRVYVLIASVKPFVLLFQQGFVRQCIKNYDLNFQKFDFNEAFKHLTNRVYQAQHPQYEQYQEDLLITPKKYEEMLMQEYGMTQSQINAMVVDAQKTIAYSIQAAKEKFIMKRGMFQLLGVDVIFDDKLKPYLIEFNTSAGLFTLLKAHLNVVPQLVQTTLDLILKTHQNMDNLNEVWKHPERLNLGRWQILQNEATGYDILAPHLQYKQQQQQQHVQTDL